MGKMDAYITGRILISGAIAAVMLVSEVGAQPVTSQNINDAPSEAAKRQALSPFRAILNSPNASTRAKSASTSESSSVRPAVRRSSPQPATAAAESVTLVRPTSASRSSRPDPNDAVSSEEVPSPAAMTLAPASAAAETPPVQAPPPPKLVALRQDPPELPPSLQRRGAQGTVRLAFSVNTDGSTVDVRVVSSTNRQLDDAAVKAVSRWLFQPIETKGLAEIDLVFEGQ